MKRKDDDETCGGQSTSPLNGQLFRASKLDHYPQGLEVLKGKVGIKRFAVLAALESKVPAQIGRMIQSSCKARTKLSQRGHSRLAALGGPAVQMSIQTYCLSMGPSRS